MEARRNRGEPNSQKCEQRNARGEKTAGSGSDRMQRNERRHKEKRGRDRKRGKGAQKYGNRKKEEE